MSRWGSSIAGLLGNHFEQLQSSWFVMKQLKMIFHRMLKASNQVFEYFRDDSQIWTQQKPWLFVTICWSLPCFFWTSTVFLCFTCGRTTALAYCGPLGCSSWMGSNPGLNTSINSRADGATNQPHWHCVVFWKKTPKAQNEIESWHDIF